MIHVYGAADPPVPRLLRAVEERGIAIHPAAAAGDGGRESSTLVLAGGSNLDPLALGVLLGGWRYARGARVLVVSRIGAHPDARARGLAALWELEETVRASGMATMTLRLAPLIGPASPLWLRLRSRPRLPRGGRDVIQPVAESDAVLTLERALGDTGPWEGWYEVAGPEALSLAELAERAREAGPAADAGAWEPPLEELAEHRLAETAPWRERFGITPVAVGEAVAGSAAG